MCVPTPLATSLKEYIVALGLLPVKNHHSLASVAPRGVAQCAKRAVCSTSIVFVYRRFVTHDKQA